MTHTEIKALIHGLITLSQEKYGLVKVGKNTLNEDILFIEKYAQLKLGLGVDDFDQIDLKAYPEMVQLKIMIEEIQRCENSKQDKHKKLNQALKAYKK